MGTDGAAVTAGHGGRVVTWKSVSDNGRFVEKPVQRLTAPVH